MTAREAIARRRRGRDPVLVGLVALLVIACGTYMGFAKRLPWADDYEIRAMFRSANELHQNSPVRIAGVNVGKVKRVERGPGHTAVVTMAIDDAGRPIHRDATMKIRPRIFLEGNFFVDLRPGTGRAPELDEGDVVPLAQTATPVQLDQVLATLNSSTRDQLQVTVQELGAALRGGGARRLRDGLPAWEGAFKGFAQVAEGLRGERPRDLSELVRAQARVSRALASRERELADLVTHFSVTVGALADHEDDVAASVRGLAATLREAHPTLGAVRDALPPLRAFTADLRPVLRAAPPTLDRALPVLRQLSRLLSARELPAVVSALRPTVRTLAALQPRLIAVFDLVRPVTECVRRNALPVLEAKIDDDHLSTGQPVWLELVHGMTGLASASQDFDGNGTAVRYHGGYGDQLFSTGRIPQVGQLFGLTEEPLIGSRPPFPGSQRQPPFRPDVPCETQRVVDLRTTSVPAPVGGPGRLAGPSAAERRRLLAELREASR